MKKFLFLAVITLAACFTSCQRRCCDKQDVVMETYVHKYGVEVPADDWASRGENGQVITSLGNSVKVVKPYTNGALDGETTYTFPHSDTIEKVETYARRDFNQRSHQQHVRSS